MKTHESTERSYTMSEVKEMLARGEDRTDWERVKALTEEELEASIDHEEEGEIDWSSARAELPALKKQLTLRLDTDIIEWFRAQGPGYQTRMNQVLRHYVDAQKK